jgi:hypothetical protein
MIEEKLLFLAKISIEKELINTLSKNDEKFYEKFPLLKDTRLDLIL